MNLEKILNQTDGWTSFFVVKWNDTIANCSVSNGSIQCYYPVGLVDEE